MIMARLGFAAFHSVLKDKKPGYQQLVPLLENVLKEAQGGLPFDPHLSFALDPKNSIVFGNMHY